MKRDTSQMIGLIDVDAQLGDLSLLGLAKINVETQRSMDGGPTGKMSAKWCMSKN
jgi:hypothetical protein